MPDGSNLSRRDFLRGRVVRPVADAAAKIVERRTGNPSQAQPPKDAGIGRRYALPVHRPPGAVDEVSFLANCARCGDCIPACPVSAIVLAPDRFRQAAGTPMIDPHAAACIMCPDTPCITACKPGVLRPDQPKKMGVAWIQTMACLAHTGSFCTVCSERCPVPGAIEVTAGKPRIREDICTGCGVCAAVCPAPANAVVLMPLADRPIPASPIASQAPAVTDNPGRTSSGSTDSH